MERRELPEGWEWKRLGDVTNKCEVINPGQFPEKQFYYIDIDAIDNTTQKITRPKFIVGKDAPSRARQKVKKNDILFSTVRTYLKNISLVDDRYDGQLASTGFCVIRVTNDVNPKFLFYFLQGSSFLTSLEKYQKGANYPAINESDIINQYIPLPPLPVQRRIVEILEHADALRRLRAQADAETQKLLQSVFYEMFGDPVRNEKGWETKKLGDLAIIKDVDHKMPKSVEYGMKFLSPKDFVGDDEIDFLHAKMISEMDFNKLSKKIKPEFGDLLYSRIGTIGKVRLVPKDVQFQISYSLCVIRLSSKLAKVKFLKYLLKNPFFEKHALHKEKSIAVPDLGLGEIENFKIIIPPLNLQKEFIDFVEGVEYIRGIQNKSEREIDRLYEGLIVKAFAGEMT